MMHEEGFIVGLYVCDYINFGGRTPGLWPWESDLIHNDHWHGRVSLWRAANHCCLVNRKLQDVKDVGEFDSFGEAAIAAARVMATMLEE